MRKQPFTILPSQSLPPKLKSEWLFKFGNLLLQDTIFKVSFFRFHPLSRYLYQDAFKENAQWLIPPTHRNNGGRFFVKVQDKSKSMRRKRTRLIYRGSWWIANPNSVDLIREMPEKSPDILASKLISQKKCWVPFNKSWFIRVVPLST